MFESTGNSVVRVCRVVNRNDGEILWLSAELTDVLERGRDTTRNVSSRSSDAQRSELQSSSVWQSRKHGRLAGLLRSRHLPVDAARSEPDAGSWAHASASTATARVARDAVRLHAKHHAGNSVGVD